MEKITWPKRKNFALCLTHDVDRIRKSFQFFTRFIREKRLYHLTSIFSKLNPYWNFDKIMEIEKKYDVRSTFFFINESKKFQLFKPSSYALSLGYYDIFEPKVKDIINKLDDGGWEIGLHGSFDSFKNEKLLLKEKSELEKILGKRIIGVRQHHLNLEIPKTWEIQRKIGFKYDTSFGSNEKIGYHNNKTLPFRPLNNKFLEIPLTIMDTPLFYHNKNLEKAWLKCYNLIKYSEKIGALMTILWHNITFNDKEFPGQMKIYEKIISECSKRNAWIIKCDDVWKFIVNET